MEIGKIANREDQQRALTFDKDGNGKLEGRELSEYLANNKAEKKHKEADKQAFFRELDDTYKNGETLSQLRGRLDIASGKGVITNDPELKAALTNVLSKLPTEFGIHYDDYKNTIKNVKNQLTTDLEKDILKKLEKMIKNECQANAQDKVENDYLAKMQEFEEQGITGKDATPQKIMEAVKADAKKAKGFKDEYKDAFESLEKNGRMTEAMMLVYKAIKQVEDKTNGKDVQKAAKQYLIDNNQWDKYTEKALVGDKNIFKKIRNGIIGQKSDGRILSDNQGRENNVEAKYIQTDKEVQKALGKRYHFLTKMANTRPDLVSFDKATGKWNIEGLSKAIREQVGANYKLDRTIGAHKEISEREKTTNKLNIIADLQKEGMSWGDIKKFVHNLCGFDIEGKHWGRIIAGSLLGAAAGAGTTAASSAGAAYATKNQVYIEGDTVTHNLNLNIKGDFASVGDISGLPEGVQISSDKTGLLISIAQLVKQPDLLLNLPKHIARIATLSAIPGALLGGAFGALAASKDKPEAPILSNNFTAKTLEEYLEEEKNNKYYTVIEMLAGSFRNPDGSWDREGYKDFLNTMGGNGGIINREELMGGILDRLEKIEDKPQDDPIDNNEDEGQGEEIQEEEHSYNTKQTRQDHYAEVPTIDGTHSGWEQIADTYDCLKDRPKAERIRILKIVQAINNGDYSTENIERLLKLSMSKKGTAHMKGVEGIDFDVYDNVIRATYLGKDVKVPPTLMGCERDTEKSIIAGKSSGKPDTVVAPKGSAKDRYYTGSTYTYYARYDGGAWIQYGSMQERDKAVAEFRKKHPNATVEKKQEE